METTMTGTEKQITWATAIRTRTLHAFDRMFAPMPANHEAAPLVAELREAIANESDSRFWIDRNGATEKQIMLEIARRNERTARLAQ